MLFICFLGGFLMLVYMQLVYMQLLPFLLQNEAEKSKRRWRAQDDSLSTQSACALHVAAQKFADCCVFVMTPLLRICKCVMHWHAVMCKQVKLTVSSSLSGMYQDVQGQLCNEETLAHPRTSGARLRRVRQSVCREFEIEEAPTRTHGRETFPGEVSHVAGCQLFGFLRQPANIYFDLIVGHKNTYGSVYLTRLGLWVLRVVICKFCYFIIRLLS